jgi:hypothetical protein
MDKKESSIQEKALQHYSPGTPAYNNKLESLGSAYFKEMLHQWLDSYPGDSRGSNSGSWTWSLCTRFRRFAK